MEDVPEQDQAPPPRRGYLRGIGRFVGWLIALPLWLIVLLAAVALAGAWLTPVDLATESPLRQLAQTAVFGVRVFQFHIGLGCAACAILAFVIRHRRLMAAALLVAMPVLAAETWRATPSFDEPPAGETLRIAAANIYGFNTDLDAIEAEIRRLRPNVIVLEEFNTWAHHDLLDRLSDVLPHSRPLTAAGIRGFAVLADRPIGLLNTHPNASTEGRRRVLIDFDGQPIAIYVVHHRSPGGVDTVALNFRQTNDLIQRLPDEELPAVYLGDFNANTWTPQLVALRQAGLTEAFDAAAWGRGGTWPNAVRGWDELGPILPLGLGVRIDNIFLTDDLAAVDAGVGESTGSDHLPVWADICLSR